MPVLCTAALIVLAASAVQQLAAARRRGVLVDRHVQAGRAALGAGDPRQAQAAAERALALSPTRNDARALYCRAGTAQLLAAPDRLPATAAPGLAHELTLCLEDGDDAALQVARGVLADLEGAPDAARAAFEGAVRADERFGLAHYYLGNHALRAGDATTAEAPLRRAAELLPNDRRPRLALGLALAKQEKWALSEEVLARLVESSPDATALVALGDARLALHRDAGAIEAYSKAVPLAGAEATPIREKLGLALLRARRFGEALGHLKAVYARDRSVSASFGVALAYQGLGEQRQAAAIFERVVTESPTLAEAHLRLIEARIATGDAAAAREAVARLVRLAAVEPRLASAAGAAQRLLQSGPPRAHAVDHP